MFREVTDKDSFEFDLGERVEIVKTVISNADTSVKVNGDRIDVTFAEPRAYVLIEIKTGENSNV